MFKILFIVLDVDGFRAFLAFFNCYASDNSCFTYFSYIYEAAIDEVLEGACEGIFCSSTFFLGTCSKAADGGGGGGGGGSGDGIAEGSETGVD